MAAARDLSDEDEILDSDDEQTHGNSKQSNTSKSYNSSDSLFMDGESSPPLGENSKRNRSRGDNAFDLSSMRTPNPKRFSGIGMNDSGSAAGDRRTTSSPSIEVSDKSSADSRSSDIEIQSDQSDLLKSIVHDISVVSLNSSDEENHRPLFNSTTVPSRNGTGAIPKTSILKSKHTNLVQPKLQFNTANQIAAKQNFVSRAYYQQKVDDLAELEKELIENQNLLRKLGNTLPDKGANLKRRCEHLQLDYGKKQSALQAFRVEEDHLDLVEIVDEPTRPKTEPGHEKQTDNNNTAWLDELEQIQPIHTGKQGMATFNQQRTLTLNRIEKLHRALETCPTETDHAPQPNHLSIQLMPHQLHAIKWMHWREKGKRPKGGLLADDMGLGEFGFCFFFHP